MDLEYDCKFEEMKKYIPFLESMIKRLENTSLASNPRQAQLDKIRSLRDLLMDKKKRMKMENLLKCEQVLVNLYEKVEQRDSLPGFNKNVTQKKCSDLNTARNKLKSAVAKIPNENSDDTLPEIARASVTEEVCVPGSKEPALFQRRPNKSSISPIRAPQNKKKELSPQSKKSYTRVLLSPERSQDSWSVEEISSEKNHFNRRSPRKSPRRRSPSYHKKERKKNVKNKSKDNLSKDLNITLKVPEESLNSLNTKDILSRIINCSDKDVDIETLRGLRSQILGELKETGANEDISDLILKSYKKKSKNVSKTKEVEEGEISDSESEAIESIYGSLVIMDNEKVQPTSTATIKADDENLRKIQICLVINSDKSKETNKDNSKNILPIDLTDSESKTEDEQNNIEPKHPENKEDIKERIEQGAVNPTDNNHSYQKNTLNDCDNIKEDIKIPNDFKDHELSALSKNYENNDKQQKHEVVETVNDERKPNFYNQTNERDLVTQDSLDICQTNKINISSEKLNDEKIDKVVSNISNTEKFDTEIPLLEPTKDVSEIDILQALKKEILCETNNVLSTDVETPLLHQPKISKVVNANEVGSKKRISIEKYKAKTNASSITTIDKETSFKKLKDDIKKQSLKLTEKECERFNFPSKLSLGETSEEEEEKDSKFSLNDIYENLAPKSPDHEDFADTGIKPPVIIPNDRVQTAVVSSQADIDMRKILPILQSCNKEIGCLPSAIKEINSKSLSLTTDIKNSDKSISSFHDPRMKRDGNRKSESPNPYSINVDKTSRVPINFNNTNKILIPNVTSPLSLNVNSINRNLMISPNLPPNINIPSLVSNVLPNITSNVLPNMTPTLLPNMTPSRTTNVPNMTPNARFDMTPSRQISDVDDFANMKHVYAPMFSADNRDHSDKLRDTKHQPWDNADKQNLPFWEDVSLRENDNRLPFEQFQSGPRNERLNFDQVMDCPPTPNSSFGRLDCPPTPNPSFGRLDCPPTPNPSFGRLDCPPTPNPSFGRLECPPTPNPSFGRLDCPSTSNTTFGRLDCPAAPTSSFGRIDAPMTTIHPFGRSECPSTPNHPFGRPEQHLPSPFTRTDYNQPVQNQSFGKPIGSRLNRSYDNFHNRDDDRDRAIYQENSYKSNSYQNNRNNNSDYYRRYQREQSVGRNEKNRNYENCKNYDNNGRNYRDSRHEASVGRYNRDYDNDRFTRNQKPNYDYRRHNDSKNDDRDRRYRRDKSADRTASRSLPRDSTNSKFSKESPLSVQCHSDPSLTIDTNIKSSFQDINDKKNNISFTNRRQRAASVGRSLGREVSPCKQRNNESKDFINNFEDRKKRTDFRRASSVGRDMKESKLGFKDIKEDLKSFKLTGNLKWSKVITTEDNSSSPGSGTRSRREMYDSHGKSSPINIKYSPKKNIRDPRMRRENINENKNIYKDTSKSKDFKSYGIVYSNDNITKGTILGPGYGVKNYKIPKLKRAEELVENKYDIDDVNAKKNVNEEGSKMTSENVSNLEKKSTDKQEFNQLFSKNKSLGSKEASKEVQLESDHTNKTRGRKKVLDSFVDIKVTTEQITQDNKNNVRNSPDYTSSDKKQVSENNALIVFDDNIDRRITRSTSRSFSKESSIELSPVKRSKRTKKPLVYESDSDDSTAKINEFKTGDSLPKNENTEIQTSNKDFKEIHSVATMVGISKPQDVLRKSTQKAAENQSTDLESNFGMDDLEIFSDNIASDTVIDNINDLIADLDQDLDPPKTAGNNNFTNELSLETMLENITSPECDETSQEMPVKLPSQTNLEIKKEIKLEHNDMKFISIDKKEMQEQDGTVPVYGRTNDISANLEKSYFLEKNQSKSLESMPTKNIGTAVNQENNENSNTSLECASIIENQDKIKKICLNENNIPSETLTKTQNLKISDKDMSHSDDDTVSTSKDGKVEVSPVKGPEKKIVVETTPDSTMNSSNVMDMVDSERNLPDSTNDLSEEKNPVNNSDHNDPSSSNTQTSNKIENIGMFLSILQDKTKIKELLGMLGDQSSENEKIKKKLEKLSEIVSDDEDTIDKDAEKVDLYSKESKYNDNISNDLTYGGSMQQNYDEKGTPEQNNQNIEKSSNGRNENSRNVLEQNNQTPILMKTDETSSEIVTKDSCIDNRSFNKEENILTNDDENNDQESSTSIITKLKTKKINKPLFKKGKRKTKSKLPIEERRLTRSDAANLRLDKPVVKKPSRELQNLQADINEMFIRDDILNATGIRMCRLAKFAEETKNQKDESLSNENKKQEPIIVKKNNNSNVPENSNTNIKEKSMKKPIKGKKKVVGSTNLGIDPVNKIKTKLSKLIDPYEFDTDSLNETLNSSNDKNLSSASESDSIESSQSFGSTEILEEVKKKKRKSRKGWKAGVIKPKNKKKKHDSKTDSDILNDTSEEISTNIEIPDPNCFTDKTYYFDKTKLSYDCRLCHYHGADIVNHYKKQHPHSEIPLSRMNPATAMEAIKESEKINFLHICKLSSKRHICRFCFKEFGRKNSVLESFFWHVVSMHTGEYKQLCAECLNVTRCPFSLDIPPPPKDMGQLLGYVCEKCNYTQISLENLKSHVILRHNDEQTAVYTINLSVMAKSIINNHLSGGEDIYNTSIENRLRVLRSSRSNQSIGDSSDVRSDSTEECDKNFTQQNSKSKVKKPVLENEKVVKTSTIQSKITFENDNTHELLNFNKAPNIKLEPESNENPDDLNENEEDLNENQDDLNDSPNCVSLQYESEQHNEKPLSSQCEKPGEPSTSSDIFNYPHFKIKISDSGSKEYICCINGAELHYRTTLLISFKKHVQLKHAEIWDGFCFICKVIVTPQGKHLFKECLQHFLDQHMDDFPIFEETRTQSYAPDMPTTPSHEISESPKPYINVRPMSQLISQSVSPLPEEGSTLPVIKSVVSLGTRVEDRRPSSCTETSQVVKLYNYEEAQAEIISQKHRVVLGAMLTPMKLVQVFKCAGRFCSFTTNIAEDALIHASTHTEIGGENSLRCAYCDFDTSGNAIDLVTHVFKDHGCCQYSCGLCFYRAAASQLINAHIARVHGTSAKGNILYTTFQTSSIKEDNILSRETAVPYYLCCASIGPQDSCKFRTYTPGKFCEHLQTRHSSLTDHLCFLCQTSLNTPADLIRHLKTHGLKLYQCTSCVFGADNETELLAHQSSKHPDRPPKAYLRIITNKEGTSEFRVLPLAHLNKSDIPITEITTSNVKHDPIKDAERSIELEKLIGQTTIMMESMVPESNTADTEPIPPELHQNINQPFFHDTNIEAALEQSRKQMVTPPPISENILQIENQLTPIIKSEAVESPEKAPIVSDVVLCLDSDEEDASRNIIDLSDDLSISRTKKSVQPKLLPLNELFVCSQCKMILKCGATFRKHISTCFDKTNDPIDCAHCTMKIRKRLVVSHYTKHHSKLPDVFACTKCHSKFASLPSLKEHERTKHSNLVGNKPGPRKGRKRSLVAKETNIDPPEKIKKYSPGDRLPINPIMGDGIFCSLCEFSTKVRSNMVRHLKMHAELQPVPQTAPVNPVPHLETNEKHFDKMVNLASSSLALKVPDRSKNDNSAITLQISPEAASRYPKYVLEKHRHTCGAKGCSYISVDESMLKCHWETLHSGANAFRCVHCPPHQQLDTSRPLTAGRILAHLKMHDATLYACSLCSYYHYKINFVENHLADVHKGGQVLVVREEGSSVPTPPVATTSQAQTAPTMDLKPWQCGICKFKSLLRPEVVEHCAKVHNSKMQYKCSYCAFRASNSENIIKHQLKSHSNKQQEIFYYYYREGSVPDEVDGTPLWQTQSQKCDVSATKIKCENPSEIPPSPPPLSLPVAKSTVSDAVNLNLVKKEVLEQVEESVESLCKDFGDFCEPNGLKYKCSLCKNVVEDSLEAMQSHLFEELKYRKWGCSICTYKAFHKAGLSIHMQTEHRQNKEPVALQLDNRIETWVAKLLEHQTELIKKNKENLIKQKEEILRTTPSTSTPMRKLTETGQTSQSAPSENSSGKLTMVELERLFGSLGASVCMSFCCPKCNSIIKDEDVMQQHLESELNKIRWLCSNCFITFQNYHEAQFHCRSVHVGQSARPMEATRDPAVRSAWVEAVIHIQKLSMNYVPLPPKTFGRDIEKPEMECSAPENSLLVVRYEERVSTPEELTARRTPVLNQIYDDDKSLSQEPAALKEKVMVMNCSYCEYKSINSRAFREHVLRHYNLKPTTCSICGISGSKKTLEMHHKNTHPNEPLSLTATVTPSESPTDYLQRVSNTVSKTKQICLVCRKSFTETEAATHVHDKESTNFGIKGDVVVKCNICLNLYKDVNAYFNHHRSFHPNMTVNYVFCKLNTNVSESKMTLYACSFCDLKFSQLRDMKTHSESLHSSQLKYTIIPKPPEVITSLIDLDEENEIGTKRPPSNETLILSPCKKVAKKSTTKLPSNIPSARKSTTKLPFNVANGSSAYGTRPSTEGLENVTAHMSFCNTAVPLSLQKLNEIMKINPIVLVTKLKQ